MLSLCATTTWPENNTLLQFIYKTYIFIFEYIYTYTHFTYKCVYIDICFYFFHDSLQIRRRFTFSQLQWFWLKHQANEIVWVHTDSWSSGSVRFLAQSPRNALESSHADLTNGNLPFSPTSIMYPQVSAVHGAAQWRRCGREWHCCGRYWLRRGFLPWQAGARDRLTVICRWLWALHYGRRASHQWRRPLHRIYMHVFCVTLITTTMMRIIFRISFVFDFHVSFLIPARQFESLSLNFLYMTNLLWQNR